MIFGREPVSRAADDRPRSHDRFGAEDLDFLSAAALRDLADFEARHPIHRGLQGRLLCIALCQGAAAHLVDGEGGVHDFDVWSFIRRADGVPDFPVRRRMTAPFERPTFLASSRRIDLLGRSIADLGDARTSLASYLASGRTRTSRALAERPAWILYPAELRGAVRATDQICRT